MTTDSSPSREFFEPARPGLIAALVFLAAALTLCWPMATGQFLVGPSSDQYVAGYGFRLFAAEYFREHGSIPLWNPYLFGGLPFVGAMHGDVFYPTAWLRWILPTDAAMNLGFAVHIVLAGCAMYAFLRALGVSWAGAVTGGLAYELTGLVASLVHPGHDGKLFVAALTPFVFLAILRAVRDRRPSAFGLLALGVGLSLHGHPQLSYYLLVAAALWGAYLLFVAPGRPLGKGKLPLLAGALGAVAIGFGIYAIQALPFIEYIPYSPRAAGGPSGGWDYATAFSLPPDELMSLVIPEFNGLTAAYWGRNFPIKHHTEYVGVLPLMLAMIGAGDRARRPIVLALGGIGLFFLLIALGRYTPFYQLWYEVVPMMKKVRAPGMAFFLSAFPIAVFAGFGADRLLRGDVPARRLWILGGVAAGIGLLGVLGVLQAVAEALVPPQQMQAAVANAGSVRAGGVRVLLLGVAAAGLLGAIAGRRLAPRIAPVGLAVLTVADLWSVERRFFVFQSPGNETYPEDELIATMRRAPLPFRVWDPPQVGLYNTSWLMAHRIPDLLGYHGNEIRFFDELLGGKNVWENQQHPAIWRLYAIRYLLLPGQYDIPGYRLALGPATTATGAQAYLYEADPAPPWATVVPAAAKVEEARIIPTVLDPRFPVDRLLLYPDTATVSPSALEGGTFPEPSTVRAEVAEWRPGRIRIHLQPAPAAPAYLVVAENWFKDWRVTVDGTEGHALRGDHALLSAALPAGAREVVFEFRSRAYERGRWITFVSVAAALALLAITPILRRRRGHG
ncbi:MAG TPA: hypothetical protein VGA42_00420 [Gemmatimonadales bacterium]